MSTTMPSQPRHVRHADGEVYPVMGDPMRFIMTSEHTGGGYALSEIETRPRGGAPPHIHHHEEECFYVLDGTFSVIADGQEHRLETGDFIHISRGTVRAFTNTGQSPGRLLILHCPGSAAGFYIAMGKLPFPPPMDQVVALGDRFGIEIVAPNA